MYEVFHARQKTIDTQYDENGWLSSVQASTLFNAYEDLYKKSLESPATVNVSIERQHELYIPVIDKYDEKMKAYEPPVNAQHRTTYYCFVDIDGNGIDELLLDFGPNWYGYYAFGNNEEGDCFGIYTLVNERPVAVYEPEYSPRTTKGSFVQVFPDVSLIAICNGNTAYSYIYKYFVYYKDAMSGTPIITENYWHDGDYYEVDGIKYKSDDYHKLWRGKYSVRETFYMKIYHGDELLPVGRHES